MDQTSLLDGQQFAAENLMITVYVHIKILSLVYPKLNTFYTYLFIIQILVMLAKQKEAEYRDNQIGIDFITCPS